MSVDGTVAHLDTTTETDDLLARVLSLNMEESRGVITSESVRLKGLLRPLRVCRTKTPSGVIWIPRFQHGKPHLGWAMSMGSGVFMDIDQDYDGTYFCMPVTTKYMEGFVGGLVLQETGKVDGEFTRIGIFHCAGEDGQLLQACRDNEDVYPCESYDAVENRHVIIIV